MKKLTALLIISVLVFVLAGCGTNTGRDYIDVTWKNGEKVTAASIMSDGSSIDNQVQKSGKRYAYTKGPISQAFSRVTAELYQDGVKTTSTSYNFAVDNTGKIESQEGNTAMLSFDTAGEGTVSISSGETTTNVSFEVFPCSGIGATTNWSIGKGIDFQSGTLSTTGDMVIDVAGYIPNVNAFTTITKNTDFWTQFDGLTNLDSYTYNQSGNMWTSTTPATSIFNNIYLIKTSTGYAKVMFTHSTWYSGDNGYAWEFIYDYSPDGKF